MRTVSLRFADMTDRTRIPIGLVGENLATRVIIDCKKIYEQYPNAAASLTVKPPFESPFPSVVSRKDNTVVWDVPNTALTQDGEGEVQIAFTIDEKVVRSATSKIEIKKSLIPTGDIPDPIDDFLRRANAALSLIPETINEALQEAKDSGEFDGFSPTATISQNDREIVIAITDKNGTTTGRFYMISSYTELNNKPSINNVVLEGNKSASEFGITMIPQGGSLGQYLAKASNTDFDIEWKTETGETIDYSNLQNKPQIAGVVLNGSKSLNDFGIASEESVNTKADKTNAVLNGTLSLGRIEGTAVGANSIALGNGVTANANNMHAQGVHNVADTLYPAWLGYLHYSVGDKVVNPYGVGVVCKVENSDAMYDGNNWEPIDNLGSNSVERTAFVIGNGTDEHKANAMRVDWDGNAYIFGDLYTNSNAAGTTGSKVATTDDIDERVSGIESHIDESISEIETSVNEKADKTNTVLNTTLSIGRKNGTVVGVNSVALGNNVEASAAQTFATGYNTVASASYSHAEGYQTVARGQRSHAEGDNTTAVGAGSHAEGYHTSTETAYAHAEGYGTTAGGSASHAEGMNATASGAYSHAEGHTTTANHLAQHVFGQSNVADPSLASPTARGNYVEIVGNGTANTPSNARTLDWDGNERLAGEVYVNCNGDSTGGVRLAKITDIPSGGGGAEKFIVNFTVDENNNVTSDKTITEIITAYTSGNIIEGIVTMPFEGVSYTVPATYYGVSLDNDGTQINMPIFMADGEIKLAITGQQQGNTDAWFFDVINALSRSSSFPNFNALGYRITSLGQPVSANDATTKTYVDTALSSKYEKPSTGIPASDLASGVIPSVPVQAVQVNGSSVVDQNGVANVPIASTTPGVVAIDPSYGIGIYNNKLVINGASSNDIKSGNNSTKAMATNRQHEVVFFGLSKAAGVDLKNETVTVGTYTADAKAAIKTMLGVQEGLEVVRLI